MKQTIFAAIALVVLAASCTKIKNLANIHKDIPYSAQVSVPKVDGDPGTPLPFSVALSLPSVAFATNSKEYVSQYGTAAHLVTTVYLKSLALQIQTPPDKNFDFLDNAQLYISAKNLPEKLVASQNNVPKGTNTLNLETNTEVNLKDYFLQDTIYFRLGASINAVPPTGVELKINSVFHLVANPLN
ncbi:MAG: hypothetical protein K0Q79_3619 [Flavipsychrobacter sp.]|jgi:hypothetical protein|nr:hypothetical protein [Flavipsychrobacter sp.]